VSLDWRAIQQLVLKYEPVGRKVAAKAFGRCRGRVPLEDLQQAAQLGLLKAAQRWEPDLGSFPAFSRTWAYQECQALLRQPEYLPEPERMDERFEAPEPYEEPDELPIPPIVADLLQRLPELPETHCTCARLWALGRSDLQVLHALRLRSDARPLLAQVRRDLQQLLQPTDPQVQLSLPFASPFLAYHVQPFSARPRASKPRHLPDQLGWEM